MTAAPIASAYIRIRPDFGTFTEDTKATTDRATTAASGKVKIGADTGEAKVALDALKVRLDELKAKTAEARVKLSGDDRARSQIDRVDLSLRKLGLTVARPKINLEGVARAQLQLEELQLRLDALNRRGGGGGRGLLGGGLPGRLPSGPGGLLGAALFAAPAAIPLAGVGAGALASLLTPTAAGALGLGLFGAASKSSITQIDTVAKKLAALHTKIGNTPATTTTTTPAASSASIQAAQARLSAAQGRLFSAQLAGGSGTSVVSAQASVASAQASLAKLQAQGGTTTTTSKQRLALLKQEHDLLKNLDPAQRKAVKNVQAMDATWAAFQKHLQPQTFGALATGAGIVKNLLTDVQPLTVAVGNTVVDLEKKAGAAFKDPFWHDFFTNFLTKEAPLAVKTLGDVVGNIGTGLAHLVEGFAPLGHDAERLATTWSARFEAWASGQGPGKFVKWVEKEGPIAGRALHGIVQAVAGIGKGLSPIGQVELKALTPVLNFVGKLGDKHPAVITAIGTALLGVGAGLKVIAGVKGIEGIIGGIGRLRGGGIKGIIGGAASKLDPVPVYVTNWHGGPGGGPVGTAGKAAKTAEADAAKVGEGAAAKGIIGRLGTRLGGALEFGSKLSNPALLAYIATQGGDQAPGQNGPAYGSPAWLKAHPDAASALLYLKDPTGVAKGGDFPMSDYPGGRLNVNSAVQTLLATGTAAQIQGLHELARTYPAVKAALQDYQQQQGYLNKELLVNPGLSKNVMAANSLLGQSLDGLGGKAGKAGAALEAKLGRVARHVGIEIQGLANSLQNFLNAPVHPAPPTGGGVSRNNRIILGGGSSHGSAAAPRGVLSGSLSSGAQIGTAPVDPALAGLLVNAQSAGTVTALLGMVGRVQRQLQSDLSSAQSRLQNDLSARTGVVSGVAGGLYGAADIGNAYVNGRVGNISGFLGNFARSDKRLLRDERQLRLRHLSGRLIEQIAQAGPIGGVALAESILSGRSGSIAHLNQLDRSVYGYAQGVGRTVGGALFDTRIGSDRAKVDEMLNELRTLNRSIDAMKTILKNNPHDLAAALDALARGIQHQHHSRVG